MKGVVIQPDLGAHLTAGRRAAVGAVIIEGKSLDWFSYEGPNPDVLEHGFKVLVNGINIGPAIDAAVIETMVRLQHPDVPVVVRSHRPWWRFWR